MKLPGVAIRSSNQRIMEYFGNESGYQAETESLNDPTVSFECFDPVVKTEADDERGAIEKWIVSAAAYDRMEGVCPAPLNTHSSSSYGDEIIQVKPEQFDWAYPCNPPIQETVTLHDPHVVSSNANASNCTNTSSSSGSNITQKQGIKSAKLVVWHKKSRAKEEVKVSDENLAPVQKSCCRDDKLFIVKCKLSASGVSGNKKQEIKSVDSRILKPSTTIVKRKKLKKVKQSSKKDYKNLLSSYIKSQHSTESEKMKENGDANLMWLLDFKVDTLFQQEDQSVIQNTQKNRFSLHPSTETGSMTMDESQLDQSLLSLGSPRYSDPIDSFDPTNPEHAFTVDLGVIDDVANFEQVECPMSSSLNEPKRRPPSKKPTEQIEYGGGNASAEISFDELGKPRCTYTELIERALTESGGLTVSEIYQWISDRFGFFRADDDRWKNSVRHNLSINPYFKKGEKARSGAGHLWTISEESRALRPSAAQKRGNSEGSQELSMPIENDTDRAVATILGQYNIAKASMEGKGQLMEEDVVPESKANEPIMESNCEEQGLLDVCPVLLDYNAGHVSEFPSSGFTIELSGLNIPESGSLGFEDLISTGRLIFIQNDEEGSDKENMQCQNEQLVNSDYTNSNEESQSQATERVSVQLISEALNQDYSLNKDDSLSTENQHLMNEEMRHEMHYERERSHSQQAYDYITLSSIDSLALQNVLNTTPNGCSSSQNLIFNGETSYEHKDTTYPSNYDQEVI